MRILDFLSDFEVRVYDTFLRGKKKVNIYIYIVKKKLTGLEENPSVGSCRAVDAGQ